MLRAGTQINPEFLFLLTRTHGFRGNGEKHMVGSGGQKRVPAEYINSYGLLLPPKDEQSKITTIIHTWDTAIHCLEGVLAAKSNRRLGLMQSLLVGKIRLAGVPNHSWRAVRIGSLLGECDRYVNWNDDAAYRFASIRRRSGGLLTVARFMGVRLKQKC